MNFFNFEIFMGGLGIGRNDGVSPSSSLISLADEMKPFDLRGRLPAACSIQLLSVSEHGKYEAALSGIQITIIRSCGVCLFLRDELYSIRREKRRRGQEMVRGASKVAPSTQGKGWMRSGR